MKKRSYSIPAIEQAGEQLLPAFELPFKKGKVLGFYIDPIKAMYLVKAFLNYSPIDVYLKDDAIYERLKVKELIHFYRRLYHADVSTQDILNVFDLVHLANIKVHELDLSEKRKLHFVKFYLSDNDTLVLDEPFQNISRPVRRQLVNIIEKFDHKMVIVLSNNLEDLIDACTTIYRLDQQGIKSLDIGEEELDQETTHDKPGFRIDKIPTKKDDKIILFNPPEIDYIESVAGEVNIYVAGVAYPCAMTLTELNERLAPLGFFRCHRSYIVNLQKVREIITWTRNSYSLSIDSHETITVPLSKNNLPILKKMIGI